MSSRTMQEEKVYMTALFKSWLRESNSVRPERMAKILDQYSKFFNYFEGQVPIPINSTFQKYPFKLSFKDRMKLGMATEFIEPGSLSPDIRHFRLKCRMIKEFMLRTSQKLKENRQLDGEARHLLNILCDRIERLNLEPYRKDFEAKGRKKQEEEHPAYRSDGRIENEDAEAGSWKSIKWGKQKARTQEAEVEDTSTQNQQNPVFSQSEVDLEMDRIIGQYSKEDEEAENGIWQMFGWGNQKKEQLCPESQMPPHGKYVNMDEDEGAFWKMVQERKRRKEPLYSKAEAEAEMARICDKYAKKDENGNIQKS